MYTKTSKPRPDRIKTLALMLLALFAVVGICRAETPQVKLSRQQAIAMAIGNNIDLRVRALDASLAENEIKASRSIYNPYLSAALDYSLTSAAGETYGTETTSGNLSVAKKLPTGATVSLSTQTGPTSAVSDPLYDYTDWSSSVGITVYQPLLKNAGRQATELAINQDEYAHAESLAEFRGNLIDTVFSVVRDYNRLYVQRQLLVSREAAVQSAQQLLEDLRTRPSPDGNPEVELANTEYALSQRQTELIEAERQVSSQEASLRYLIGLDEVVHLIPLDSPSPDEPLETEEDAVALALQQRPDLQELRLRLESNRLREAVSRRNLWPDLAVTASAGYRGYVQDGGFGDTLDQIGQGRGEYWSAGMRLTIPLGNDLAESDHRRTALRVEQLRNQLTAAEWQARDIIREDNRSLISARLQLRSTAKSNQLAEQRVAQYQRDRRRGAASVKDLLDAEDDLIHARNQELTAIENFSLLVARLWKDIGVLLERQNVTIDTSQPEQLTAGKLPVTALSTSLVGPAAETDSELAQSTAAGPQAAAVSAKPSGTAQPSNFSLRIGEYFASELPQLKQTISLAGLHPVVTDGPGRARDVVRLRIGEYPDLVAAQSALQPLQKIRSSGFILKNESGRYAAYAGSFFSRADAETEQQQLAAHGLKLELKQVSVVLPTHLLTTTALPSREAALAGLERLKQQGLAAEIRPVGAAPRSN